MYHTETKLRNEISKLRKQLSGNTIEWISESEAADYVLTSVENMRKIRMQCPMGLAWKCRGGDKVDSEGRTVRRGIKWNKKWLDDNPHLLLNRYPKKKRV